MPLHRDQHANSSHSISGSPLYTGFRKPCVGDPAQNTEGAPQSRRVRHSAPHSPPLRPPASRRVTGFGSLPRTGADTGRSFPLWDGCLTGMSASSSCDCNEHAENSVRRQGQEVHRLESVLKWFRKKKIRKKSKGLLSTYCIVRFFWCGVGKNLSSGNPKIGLRDSLSARGPSGHIEAPEVRPARAGTFSTPVHPAPPRTGGSNPLAAPPCAAEARLSRQGTDQ